MNDIRSFDDFVDFINVAFYKHVFYFLCHLRRNWRWSWVIIFSALMLFRCGQICNSLAPEGRLVWCLSGVLLFDEELLPLSTRGRVLNDVIVIFESSSNGRLLNGRSFIFLLLLPSCWDLPKVIINLGSRYSELSHLILILFCVV